MIAAEQLNVAVIGLGVGQQHIVSYEKDKRCKVIAVCDIDPSKLELAKKRWPHYRATISCDDIFSDDKIDLVSIASYDDVHAKQIVKAIKAGKHVFVEKPLCLLREEFEQIVEVLEANPTVKLASNLILRKVVRFAQLHSRIQSGELGEIYFIGGDYDYGRLEKLTSGWRSQIPYYSVMFGGGIHIIDLIQWLTKAEIEEVFAYSSNLATKGSESKCPDLVCAILQFKNGSVGKVTANFASVTPHHHNFCVYGTKGTFFQGHMGTGYSFSRDREVDVGFQIVNDLYPGVNKGDLLPEFIDYIVDGTSPNVTTQEVLDSMAVAFAIEASLISGQPEPVSYAKLSRKDQ